MSHLDELKRGAAAVVTVVATFAAFVLVTVALYQLWGVAIGDLNEVGSKEGVISTPLAAALLGTWVFALIVGLALIRDSRPYSASWVGRLVAWLGIGIVLVTLSALLTLSRTLMSDISSASPGMRAHTIDAPQR